MTHARAIQLSTDATMSLHVDADFKENIYLAGKLAELVAMGKTILAITPSLSACRDYLGNQARVDCVAPNDEMKIAECFLKRYKEWEKCNRGSIDYRYINQTVFSASSVDTQVKKLLLGEND
ncbi:MAG: hypothetical protein BroJett038_33190 [Chloroflexota bacterium]|nr:MAG: hypothetical protein BroJett038_33190 [Chloroflexota bacterium]